MPFQPIELTNDQRWFICLLKNVCILHRILIIYAEPL